MSHIKHAERPSALDPIALEAEKGQMYGIINSNNGKTLKSLRLAKGFTQDKLAQLAGCSVPRISQIETGTARAGFDLAVRIYMALH